MKEMMDTTEASKGCVCEADGGKDCADDVMPFFGVTGSATRSRHKKCLFKNARVRRVMLSMWTIVYVFDGVHTNTDQGTRGACVRQRV